MNWCQDDALYCPPFEASQISGGLGQFDRCAFSLPAAQPADIDWNLISIKPALGLGVKT
jgi:hypothetical protein